MFKSGFVSIVGSPNAGKSTFINTVIGRKVSIISSKVQTTRDLIRGIYNDEDSQIVFLDTPGFHNPKNQLNVYMNQQIDMSFSHVDLVVFMLDAKYGVGKKERQNLEKLRSLGSTKIICVINKIELVDQDKLQSIVQELSDTELFEEIIPISLNEKFNYQAVLTSVKRYLTEDVKFYEDDQFTDYTDEFFAEEIIREKILHKTNQEVPHSIGIKVKEMEEEDGVLVISADVYVERDSQKGIIIGRGGSMLKEIGTAARKELKREFKQPIYLDLHVKVLSKWGQKRDSLMDVGYEIE